MASCGFDAKTELGFEDVAAFSIFGFVAGCFKAMLRAARGLSSSLSDMKVELRLLRRCKSSRKTELGKRCYVSL